MGIKHIFTFLLFFGFTYLNAQITFKLELGADNETYTISMVCDTTLTGAENLTSSAQITIKARHGEGAYRFGIAELESLSEEAVWQNNVRIDSPEEAPSWDYVSFGLQTLGTAAYEYVKDVEIPILQFKNSGIACVDSVQLIREDDLFATPNSQGSNPSNSIVVLGLGLVNSYITNHGTGRALCTPVTTCTPADRQVTEVDTILCADQTFRTRVYEEDTIVEDLYISSIGCDSLVKNYVIVQPSFDTHVDTMVCINETYQGQMFTQDTVLIDSLQTMQGCDSVVTTYLSVAPIYDTTFMVTILRGSTYEGVIYNEDMRVINRLESVVGCDSIVTVDIVVADIPTISETVELCAGENYEGMIYEETTSIYDTLMGMNGIDTIFITNLLVNPTYDIQNEITLCDNETYQGTTYTEDTSLSEEYQTLMGCDSIITTNLNVLETYNDVLFVSVCERIPYEGIIYSRDTMFTTIITAQNGCDSTVTRNINILKTPPIPLPEEIILCDLEEFPLELEGGDYVSYQWSTGSNSPSITVNQLGEYYVRVTNDRGCQDSTTVDIRLANLEVKTEIIPENCDPESGQRLTITAEATEPPLLYSLDGGLTFDTRYIYYNVAAANYELIVEDAVGCQFSTNLQVEETSNLLLTLPERLSIELGQSVDIQARTNTSQIESITWFPTDNLSCTDCLNPTATPSENTQYELKIKTLDGCESKARVVIFVDTSAKYYAPNTFSPNNDGRNDLFSIYAGDNVVAVSNLQIFNRWGNLIFTKELIQSTELDSNWTGQLNGKDVPTGIYIYTAQLELIDGRIEKIEGEITLVR